MTLPTALADENIRQLSLPFGQVKLSSIVKLLRSEVFYESVFMGKLNFTCANAQTSLQRNFTFAFAKTSPNR